MFWNFDYNENFVSETTRSIFSGALKLTAFEMLDFQSVFNSIFNNESFEKLTCENVYKSKLFINKLSYLLKCAKEEENSNLISYKSLLKFVIQELL